MIDEGAEVAAGTPHELKRRLERDVLEIRVETDADLERAFALLSTGAVATLRPDTREIHVPIGTGTATSLDTLRTLDDAAIAISDFQLRRPTLDDVFLTLTGSGTKPGGSR